MRRWEEEVPDETKLSAVGLKLCPFQRADLACNGVRDPLHVHCNGASGPIERRFPRSCTARFPGYGPPQKRKPRRDLAFGEEIEKDLV